MTLPRAWTQDEENFIRQHYRHMRAVEIAKILGRTAPSVTNRAGVLGLSSKTITKVAQLGDMRDARIKALDD